MPQQPTFGQPNQVGFKMTEHERPGLARLAGAGVLGYGGAKLTSHAIRPNVAGRIKAAEKKVEDVDRKLVDAHAYKPMSEAKRFGLERERVHAERVAEHVRTRLPLRQTKKLRLRRGLGGGVMLAGAASLAMPKKKKVVDAYMG